MDIIFALDASMSVKQAGWDTIIDFLSALINSGISTKANIAITEFARDSYIIMNFNDTANLTVSEIAAKVDALTFKNELGTNTGYFFFFFLFVNLSNKKKAQKTTCIVTEAKEKKKRKKCLFFWR